MLRRPPSLPALFMTLALHALVLLAFVGLRIPGRTPPPQASGAEDSVVQIRLYTEADQIHPDQPPAQGTGVAITEEPCNGDFYVGIGIVAGSYSGLVIVVAPGAPAARAGIRAGDEILNAEVLGANRYTEGTPLNLQVATANGSQRWVSLRVEKICNA